MYTIVGKEKIGNTVEYSIKDNETNKVINNVSKSVIVSEIQKNNIDNARIQNFKGQIIIRIKDDNKELTTSQTSNSKSNSNISSKNTVENKRLPRREVYAIDIFKEIIKEFGIKHEEEALAEGFDKYDLDEAVDMKNKYRLSKMRYKFASTVKKVADKQNDEILSKYKEQWEDSK